MRGARLYITGVLFGIALFLVANISDIWSETRVLRDPEPVLAKDTVVSTNNEEPVASVPLNEYRKDPRKDVKKDPVSELKNDLMEEPELYPAGKEPKIDPTKEPKNGSKKMPDATNQTEPFECPIINKGGDSEAPKMIFEPECAKKLQMIRKANNDNWVGLNPYDIYKKWPGLLVHDDYVLREFAESKDISEMSDAEAEIRYYQLMTIVHMKCADVRRMGRRGDGGWEVCVSEPYKPQKNCIVYSFGIRNDFSFDDAMGKNYGCQVKSYDPSMKKDSHKRSDFVYFYKVGLGPADTFNSWGWKLMTLGSLLKENGHGDKVIDYVKMDIEFNEWDSLEIMLAAGTLKKVKQFSLEIHSAEIMKRRSTKYDWLRFYNILLGLEKLGFRRYHIHINKSGWFNSKGTNIRRPCCFEIYYMNINYLK